MDRKEVKNLPVFDTTWDKNLLHVAIANNKNKIHILNGRNILMETKEFHQQIDHVTFTPCGHKVAYSFDNGNVEEFDLVSMRSYPVMVLHDAVTYLKYFNVKEEEYKITESEQILVAASKNGTLMVNRNGKCLCLRKPYNSQLKQVPIKPIVQSFFIKSVQKLLTISKNRSILLWDIDQVSCTALQGDKNSEVYSASISFDNTMLAVTMSDGSFDIFSLQVENGSLKAEYVQGKHFNVGLRSCAFSCDKKYLALGKDDGNIEVCFNEYYLIMATAMLL